MIVVSCDIICIILQEMAQMYPKNIHSLIDIACEKEENKNLCKGLYYAMKAIKSDGITESVSTKSGFLIGTMNNMLGQKEGWSDAQHYEVTKKFFEKIDKIAVEKFARQIYDSNF